MSADAANGRGAGRAITRGRTRAASRERMRDDVAELLGVAPREVSRDANLLACGLDSVRVMELASRWRRHRVEVRSADMLAHLSLDAWARLVRST